MTNRPRYISTTDTAKLIRAALKEAFPGQKFSVRSRSYSGGSSIDVSYTSETLGQREVERVVGQFSGATFDGMTDMKSYRTGVLDGEEVWFAADFVFAHNQARVY